MPRAPYNITVDVYAGAGTGTPGAYKRTVAARLVLDSRRLAQRPTVFASTHYVNCAGPIILAGAQTILPPDVIIDTSTADVLEVPSGSGLFFEVIRSEVISPRRAGLPPYNRAHIL